MGLREWRSREFEAVRAASQGQRSRDGQSTADALVAERAAARREVEEGYRAALADELESAVLRVLRAPALSGRWLRPSDVLKLVPATAMLVGPIGRSEQQEHARYLDAIRRALKVLLSRGLAEAVADRRGGRYRLAPCPEVRTDGTPGRAGCARTTVDRA
jgi:hypothetical protein